jgi:hypothetical protein
MKGSKPFAFFKFNLEDILGGPTDSVARDTNLHLEVTVRDLEAQLARLGRLSEFTFAEPVLCYKRGWASNRGVSRPLKNAS